MGVSVGVVGVGVSSSLIAGVLVKTGLGVSVDSAAIVGMSPIRSLHPPRIIVSTTARIHNLMRGIMAPPKINCFTTCASYFEVVE